MWASLSQSKHRLIPKKEPFLGIVKKDKNGTATASTDMLAQTKSPYKLSPYSAVETVGKKLTMIHTVVDLDPTFPNKIRPGIQTCIGSRGKRAQTSPLHYPKKMEYDQKHAIGTRKANYYPTSKSV